MIRQPQDHNWVAKNVYAVLIRKYINNLGGTTDFGIEITDKFLETLQKRYIQICSRQGAIRI